MDGSQDFHVRWLARYFGKPDYLPLTREDADALARAGEPVVREPGGYFFRQGDPADSAFILQSGRVELRRAGEQREWTLARVSPGSVMGDAELFLDLEYHTSALAIEHSTAYRVDKPDIIGEMAEQPRIALRWMIAAFRQLESCRKRVLLLMRRPVKAQVIDILLEEVNSYGEVHASQQDLADLLGVSRQAVARALSELREAGIVVTERNLVRVIDQEAAERVLEEE